jgi:hypothetical protein
MFVIFYPQSKIVNKFKTIKYSGGAGLYMALDGPFGGPLTYKSTLARDTSFRSPYSHP